MRPLQWNNSTLRQGYIVNLHHQVRLEFYVSLLAREIDLLP